MVAALNVQASAATAAQAQAGVNKAMQQALAAARAVAGVTATTGGYSVNEDDAATTPKGQKFQASQGLTLVMPAAGGQAPAAFTGLVGTLQQEGLLLNNLDGELSAAGRAAATQDAIKDGIAQLRAQAVAVAQSLHEKVGPMTTLAVNIDAGWAGPRPMMMMAKAAAPQLSPGTVTVSASLSATVTLTP
jgi:uncharacterized protein YggE